MSKRRVVQLAVVLSSIAVIFWITTFASASGSAKPDSPPTHTRSTTYRLDPRLRAHFAVFRRASAHTADSSASSMLIPNPRVVSFLQLDLSNIDLVQTDTGPVWVIPGGNGACVLSGQTSVTSAPQPGQNYAGCSTSAGMLQNGLLVRAGQGDAGMLFGLVPNGNSSATVSNARGARHNVSIADNVIREAIPAGGVTVAFRNASGSRVSYTYAGRAQNLMRQR